MVKNCNKQYIEEIGNEALDYVPALKEKLSVK